MTLRYDIHLSALPFGMAFVLGPIHSHNPAAWIATILSVAYQYIAVALLVTTKKYLQLFIFCQSYYHGVFLSYNIENDFKWIDYQFVACTILMGLTMMLKGLIYCLTNRVASTQQITEEVTDQSEPCSICLEDITTGVKLINCSHIYHQECIGHWLAINNTCPVCRMEYAV